MGSGVSSRVQSVRIGSPFTKHDHRERFIVIQSDCDAILTDEVFPKRVHTMQDAIRVREKTFFGSFSVKSHGYAMFCVVLWGLYAMMVVVRGKRREWRGEQ